MIGAENKQDSNLKDGLTSHCGSGFLTKAQQDILDAAILTKQKSGQLERTKSHSEEQHTVRIGKSQCLEQKAKERIHDRHSRLRTDKNQGKPKKGGAGGKYNWGATLDLESSSGIQDPNDPNYDSTEENDYHVCLHTKQSVQVHLYKEAVVRIVREFFSSEDFQEAGNSLQDLHQPDMGHYFVKRLVALSLDQNERQRELASCLLSFLYAKVLPPYQIEKGFHVLVESLEDLKVDVPDVVNMLAHFIARAVIDDILPPAFVSTLLPVAGKEVADVRRKAEVLLSPSYSAERILRCWGGDATITFTRIRESIDKLLQEYVVSGDKGEAAACVRRIGLPLVHHELVKRILQMALTNKSQCPSLLELLAFLSITGYISEDQLLKGFKRVADSIDDLALDVPNTQEHFKAICSSAEGKGWLPPGQLQAEVASQPPRSSAAMTHSLHTFKAACQAAVKEYYFSGDAEEVERCLLELDEPGFHSLVVKLAVQLAIDGKDREREMTAVLIRGLSPKVLTVDQVSLGFTRLLACAEDLTLDNPVAPHQLALMLGRMIVDEVLTPAFLTAVLPSLRDQSMGVSIVQATGKMLSVRHASERLQICWHSGSRSIEQIRSSIKDLVNEYLDSGDATEAARCWRDLGVDFYGHQLVFATLVAAFEQPTKSELLLQLIKRFAASGEVSQTQIQKGFERVEFQLPDLKLDFPASPRQFDTCKARATEQGWLHPDRQAATS